MAVQKGPRRDSGKQEVWRRIVEGHAGSGESVRAWCLRHGVSEPSFYAWRRELAKRVALGCKPARLPEPTLLPVTIASPTSLSSATFSAALEISWAGGVTVRVSQSCDVPLLRETLRVLRSIDAELCAAREAKSC